MLAASHNFFSHTNDGNLFPYYFTLLFIIIAALSAVILLLARAELERFSEFVVANLRFFFFENFFSSDGGCVERFWMIIRFHFYFLSFCGSKERNSTSIFLIHRSTTFIFRAFVSLRLLSRWNSHSTTRDTKSTKRLNLQQIYTRGKLPRTKFCFLFLPDRIDIPSHDNNFTLIKSMHKFLTENMKLFMDPVHLCQTRGEGECCCVQYSIAKNTVWFSLESLFFFTAQNRKCLCANSSKFLAEWTRWKIHMVHSMRVAESERESWLLPREKCSTIKEKFQLNAATKLLECCMCFLSDDLTVLRVRSIVASISTRQLHNRNVPASLNFLSLLSMSV